MLYEFVFLKGMDGQDKRIYFGTFNTTLSVRSIIFENLLSMSISYLILCMSLR